ncbi:acetyl-CoA C-acetyltransferase [Vibrio sp. SCSIO 43137]|uniref:acetyl-CoA C-acetyltransferase n=1 Tax=Vibrio sp. SCSIO 43137 TaxID=3021011 RepID=UPI002307B0C5|nr:acetyl-CoA C-acetyltransferase [Vibrio sp. SCSIO 43137]WCE30879.1 acetyl-CoA C-acetyltransferase [Vibrio sp. SCSIO 43137]
MQSVYIVAAKRTPIGSFCGSLSSVSAADLGSTAIRGALRQSAIDPALVDEVICGNVINAGQGMGPGRQAAIQAGIPADTPAYSLNMICGSGMKSVMDAVSHIRAGDAEIVVACGMENMSQIPYLVPAAARAGIRLGHQPLEDALLKDGLTDAFHQYHMGVTAENIARKHNLSREMQDKFALQSQKKACAAIESGHFKQEIEPVEITGRKGVTLVTEDEYPKPDSSSEKLAKLRAAFEADGSVTAGNASGINDGAAALILASAQAVKQHNLTVLAEVVSYAQAGVDPAYMGLGPVPAIAKALGKTDYTLADMQVIELNEAFAAQALGVIRELSAEHHIDEQLIIERANPNGGAIALGHPLGASGCRILVSLIYQLQAAEKHLGLASLCVGGGMGTAMMLRRN